MSEIMWQPSDAQIASANLTHFINTVSERYQQTFTDYHDFYQWSIQHPETFWETIWEALGVIASVKGKKTLINGHKMPGAVWFPDARLNFAENLLRRRDEQDAIVFWGEEKVRRRLSYRELYRQVATLANALRDYGIQPGDRIAGYMPNMPETVIAMLAATSIGATWSSCSPDFGANGVVDRFGQIEPRMMIAAEGYFYNGKSFDNLDKITEIKGRIPSIEKVLLVPYANQTFDASRVIGGVSLEDFILGFETDEIEFAQLPFNHPLYIMFSSGTTGVPKCIVHGAGGTLLQHLKEHRLHSDVKPGDRVFYFTTCGWMMWNWLVSALAAEATLLLYDGSPFYPNGNVLFDYADAEGMTLFGTSAKYIDVLNKENYSPRQNHRLSSVRTLCSTGSPLVPEAFDYVYREIKTDLCLASISGGTDIISCFALGNPILAVHKGELQCRGLGMQVEVWNDQGKPVVGEKGELVCTTPFPCMPIGFWNDPDGSKYLSAYFERFENVWCHGDYVELTESQGIIIYGRSDAVLNPGGVRIGTAEIYRQVEQIPEVLESIVIGQEWAGDVRVVLFVKLRDNAVLDDDLQQRIKQQIRKNTTPRHVPARIVAVIDIPRTKSGKIVELAVREIVHGRPVKNREALANPEALDYFADCPELSE